MLTIALFVYIILWSYVSYNTVFITKISVPKQLMTNRRSSRFLPSLLASGALTLIALTYVGFEILCLYMRYLDVQDDKGILGERVSVELIVNFEKISFLLLYVTTLVQPLLILTLNGDIRSVVRRGSERRCVRIEGGCVRRDCEQCGYSVMSK